MPELISQVELTPEGTRILLSGDITEDSDFSPLLKQARGQVTVDLAGVRSINSCGVRYWIQFVTALRTAGVPIALERCSVTFVRYLNMISNFGGGGEIRSIHAPYFCERCEQDHTRLMPVDPTLPEAIRAPIPCPRCAEPMEFDDDPNQFLDFLK